jgi:hypothetical protein
VAAGDGRAAKAVYGESKVYLELGGLPLVAHVVLVLQHVPEVSEVWVVGNAARLESELGRPEVQRALRKPLHVLPQFRNLYENAWETYRRLLPGAGPEGRDPRPEDADQQVLFLSGDIPFATPQEISAFVRRGQETGCDYALGAVTAESLADFAARKGEPGVRVAYFNLAEGRFRQSNLHLVKPARLTNRYYIEEMYEYRYQKEFGNILKLAWRLVRSEKGGLRIACYYGLMILAGTLDRRGWKRFADAVRRAVSVRKVESVLSGLLGTRFRVVVTDVGGCAIDIDKESEYDAARARFEEWRAAQRERAERLHGALPAGPAARVGPGAR